MIAPSTVIEPPSSGVLRPVNSSYCLVKFSASAPPSATYTASTSLGIWAMNDA